MKNVLVTGCGGFLGSHLCKHYLDAGDNVWGVDDFCSSVPDSKHVRELLGYERFTLKEGDITEDFSGLTSSRYKPDLILNFACPASPQLYQAMPLHTMMTCVVGTANVLELAHQTGAIVVHASTSEIYGDPVACVQRETDWGNVNPYGPRGCYDNGKRAAESLCFDYKNTYGVDARVVRIFNTYGPHLDPFDGRVVSNFIRQALTGEDLTVYGDGSQTRSFCYVDDLIRGIVAMGALDKNPGGPITLGNPNDFTVLYLAREIQRRLGS